MTGASIETTLELWASSLREVKKRMRPLFEQDRTALNAGLFVDGLLGDERRKTGWMRAEAAGDPGPWRQHSGQVHIFERRVGKSKAKWKERLDFLFVKPFIAHVGTFKIIHLRRIIGRYA